MTLDPFAAVTRSRQERTTRDAASAKSRILERAATLFAEVGFERATIRRIADAAGVNIAAINYHFGSKAGLHRSVIERALAGLSAELSRAAQGATPDNAAEQIVRAVVRVFLGASGDSGANGLLTRLLAWELIGGREAASPDEPTPSEEIKRLLGAHMPGALSPDDRAIVTHWMVGQCLVLATSQLAARFDAEERVAQLMLNGLSGLIALRASED